MGIRAINLKDPKPLVTIDIPAIKPLVAIGIRAINLKSPENLVNVSIQAINLKGPKPLVNVDIRATKPLVTIGIQAINFKGPKPLRIINIRAIPRDINLKSIKAFVPMVIRTIYLKKKQNPLVTMGIQTTKPLLTMYSGYCINLRVPWLPWVGGL